MVTSNCPALTGPCAGPGRLCTAPSPVAVTVTSPTACSVPSPEITGVMSPRSTGAV